MTGWRGYTVTPGELLRKDRVAEGLTQREVADHLGMDHTYLSKIENDQNRPSIGLLCHLADTYRTDIRAYQIAYGILPSNIEARAKHDPEFCSLMWDLAAIKTATLADALRGTP